ncbi:MAG: hypothetical protein ACT4PL_14250, partial [Phycisphaerales bacterium]
MSIDPAIQSVVGKARRRLLLAEFVRVAGTGLAIGAALGLGAAIACKALYWPALPALALPALGVAAAAALAIARRASTLDAARALDEALALRSRLANAIAFSTPAAHQDPGFLALARAEAAALAAKVNPRAALPIRFGRAWPMGAALLLSLGAVGIFVPDGLWIPPSAARHSSETARADVEAAAREIAALKDQPPAPTDGRTDAPADRAPRTALQEIENELRNGRTTADEARTRAARAVDEMAASVEREAQDRHDAADDVRSRLARASEAARTRRETLQNAADGMAEPGPESTDPAAALAEALEAGDPEAAARHAEELLRDAPDLSPEERAAAADRLEQIAAELRDKTQPKAAPSNTAPGAAPPSSSPSSPTALQTPKETTAPSALQKENSATTTPPADPAGPAANQPAKNDPVPSTSANPEKATGDDKAQKNEPQETPSTPSTSNTQSASDSATKEGPPSAEPTPGQSEPRPKNSESPSSSDQKNSAPEKNEQGREDPKQGTSKDQGPGTSKSEQP